jgi:preprotein translocase subunit SecD
LTTDTDLSGDQLDDAYVGYGEYGEPEVLFRFGADGRRKFAQITGANVQKRMAIVLDEIVQSAPVIQGRIDSDTARITLNNRSGDARKEATFIATALRAGALPAALEQLEESTVGPSLGADAISKGKVAGLVGFALVVIFMVVYYKAFGVAAAAALGINVFCLLAILSALSATLTLPGISGIVLTMGMAVDANIIVFERIKEEMARGVSLRGSIRDGFKHAFSAIFDANLTTAIAGAVLIYFGSGPVRGFGVTLIAGIITTVYTTIFVTRVILDVMVSVSKSERMPI